MQFLQYFVWGSWFVSVGSYLIKSLHFTGHQVGWVYASPGIAAMVMPYLLGIVADKYLSIQRLLALLHFTGALMMVWTSSQTSFESFFPLILIYSLTYQPTFSLTSSLCFYHLPDASSQYPKVRVLGTIGWIAGGLVISLLGWELTKLPLLLSAGASLVLSGYCMTLPDTPPTPSADRLADLGQFLKNKAMLFVMAMMLLITIPASFYYSFVNVYMIDEGISFPAAKMSIGQLSEVIVMLTLPLFLRKWGWHIVLIWGMLAWGIRYGLMAVAGHDAEWIVWIAILMHGFAYCFTGLTSQLYVNHTALPSVRATAQGIFSFVVMGLGTTLGSIIAGVIIDYAKLDAHVIWQTVWMMASSMGIVTALLFILFKKYFMIDSESAYSKK